MDIVSAVFDPGPGCIAFTMERITYTRAVRERPCEKRRAGFR